jgi:probable rRNA maturation factor
VEVFLANEQDLRVDEARLCALARHALDSEDVDDDAELSILLIGTDHIKQLNARFAGEDHATDVLAFPMEDDDDDVLLGDVVIAPGVAEENAHRLNHSLDEELDVLLVHGLLHLLGYDHQGKHDRAEMERRMRALIESFAASRV